MGQNKTDHKTDLQTRELLIEAGTHLIAEKGYDGASIGDIAAYAEVTKGAVYYYFGSKEDFVLEIIRQRTKSNIAQFRQQTRKNISLTDWIENVFATILGFSNPIQQHFLLQVMMVAMQSEHEAIRSVIAELHVEWRELIAQMVIDSEEYKQGHVISDPEVIAVGIMALIDGLLIHACIEPEVFTEKAFAKRLAPLLKLSVLQSASEN